MAESEDYIAENEDYKKRGGETETTGDDVAGDEGLLEIEIPAAIYGDGKVATAQDSDLTAENIKKDVVIFGVTGTMATGGNIIENELSMGLSHAIT